MAEEVGIRALQQHASDVVRRAAAGDGVVVTDRGRPVARLIPIRGTALDRLTAEGLVRPARRRPRDLPDPLPPAAGPALGELLAEARLDER